MGFDVGITLIIGFGLGVLVTTGLFYSLYIKISDDLFKNLSDLKKTMGWLGVKIRELANEADTD